MSAVSPIMLLCKIAEDMAILSPFICSQVKHTMRYANIHTKRKVSTPIIV